MMDQYRNDSKSHVYYSFFENIILGIQIIYISPHILVDIIRTFFYSRFSSRKSQSQRKLVKKLLILWKITYFMNLNSLDIENNMLPKHSQKPFSLYNFFSKYISV